MKFIIILVASSQMAFATPHPVMYDRDVSAICARVRALVNRVGLERAIQLARRRGYTEAQIAQAHSCL